MFYLFNRRGNPPIKTGMKVFLRDASRGCFYAGSSRWAENQQEARDLEQIELAIGLNSAEHLGATEVLLAYEEPLCVLTIPIQDW